jgi:hypothetical protein
MNIYCNAGLSHTNMVGELDGYGTVWYNPKGIANIHLYSPTVTSRLLQHRGKIV